MAAPTSSVPLHLRPRPAGAGQRLALAGGAAVVIVSLGWAALRVRDTQQEKAALREELREAQKPPAVDHAAVAATLQQRLGEIEGQFKTLTEKTGAREKELEGIITFLRQENAAAQQTIERLTAAAAAAVEPPPAAIPVAEPVAEATEPTPVPAPTPTKRRPRRQR